MVNFLAIDERSGKFKNKKKQLEHNKVSNMNKNNQCDNKLMQKLNILYDFLLIRTIIFTVKNEYKILQLDDFFLHFVLLILQV